MNNNPLALASATVIIIVAMLLATLVFISSDCPTPDGYTEVATDATD